SPWPDDRFLALSGARLPIVQAPMAGAGGVALAIGAMKGGAVGSLPSATRTPAEVIAEAAAVRAAANGPLNLHFFCHDMPVIAAGGIGDARGIAAAFLLGASAVQLGTAYLHCPESLIGKEHRAGLSGELAEHTAFTNLYSGGLARGLPTKLTDAFGPIREE